MAASRTSFLQAVRNIQRASCSVPTQRGLHMTGVREAAQRVEPAKSIYSSWKPQDLRSECQKRTLTAVGTKHELVDRLAAHDSLQHRAFHMSLRRVAKDRQTKPISGPFQSTTHRVFSTSRTLKAVHPTSTLDYIHLPKLFEGDFIPEPALIRVPILPHIESDHAEAILEMFPHLEAAAGGYQDTDAGHNQMKAQIEPIEGSSGSVSAMSDVHDGHHPEEMSVETLTQLTDTVNDSARRLAGAMKDESAFRKIWQGLLDDVLGSKNARA
ncbi:hypothetical protein R6Q59_010060 [Mikania micrantha]